MRVHALSVGFQQVHCAAIFGLSLDTWNYFYYYYTPAQCMGSWCCTPFYSARYTCPLRHCLATHLDLKYSPIICRSVYWPRRRSTPRQWNIGSVGFAYINLFQPSAGHGQQGASGDGFVCAKAADGRYLCRGPPNVRFSFKLSADRIAITRNLFFILCPISSTYHCIPYTIWTAFT